jgi:uncharacterized protein DUF4394
MKRRKMKKASAVLTVTSLALAASLAYGLMSGRSASAISEHNPSNISGISGISGASASAAASSSAMNLAAQSVRLTKTPIYALSTNNTIFVLWPGATGFTRLVRVTQANGNLIGIDFRPAAGNNNALYALTDTGSIYTVNLTATGLGAVTKVSDLTTRFPSGVQSLLDFNPVLDAIRLIGSDRSNYAVVNSGGNLNATAVQTPLSYDPNDVNKGVSPHISAGSYNNSFANATTTLFYAIDYDLDTLVTIQPAAPGGSSATGGGVLQTLGPLVTLTGQRVNIGPTADIDFESRYFTGIASNHLVGVSGQTVFDVVMDSLDPTVPAGRVTPIYTNTLTLSGPPINIIDIAIAPTTYGAENATLGPGVSFEALFPGFAGTGYANFPDSGSGAYVEFQVNQTGPQTLVFAYSNGGAVARPCNITVNGVSVGTVNFTPTIAGFPMPKPSFANYALDGLGVDLGSAPGFRTVRVTTTGAGGPNLDQLYVFDNR